ncbi:MAG: hypothetical protein LBO69_09445 [Ignavibacteria bacterium]|jgi:hypothetical protein|nr:hypothetical protein [Ignavibacteria bacterium]
MNKKINFTQIIALLISLILLGNYANAADNDIFRAMQDELNRSMQQLKLDNLKRPYYIEYVLKIAHNNEVKASLGEITSITDNVPSITLSVMIRVGDYKFDQKNFVDIGLNFYGSFDEEETYSNRRIPKEIDYPSLRRELWLATDAAYKEATEIFSRKEAALKNQIRTDTLWDYAQIVPTNTVDTISIPVFDMNAAKTLAMEVSAIFRDFPTIAESKANYYSKTATTYYLNTEGVQYVKNSNYTGFEVGAFAQASDGMPLTNYYITVGSLPSDLPTKDSIKNAVVAVAGALNNSLHATVLDDSYSGPILITGEAACNLFAQAFLPAVTTQRDRTLADNVGVSFGGDKSKAFQKKIGGRVLPTFLSIKDAPTLATYNGIKLFGHYKIDDEGVVPQDVDIVKDGYLTTLLSDRTPIKRVTESNGHSRSFAPTPSNIIITANKKSQATYADLKKQMLQLCKKRDLPYGIIVKRIQTEKISSMLSSFNLSYDYSDRNVVKITPVEVYKVFPDGKEELIRGGQITGITPAAFKDIIKVGNKNNALTILQPYIMNINREAWGGVELVTIIGQDLLFEDAEFQVVDKNYKKPPYIANPLSEKK